MKQKSPTLRHGLKNLFEQHGAITFILAFAPLIPKVHELHTKGYLSLTRRLVGSIHHIDDLIKVMFGAKGYAVYEEYKKKHPRQILPEEIFNHLFETNEPNLAIKKIQAMFFDRAQRNFVYADKMRAAVIFAVPEMLRLYPQDQYADFRSTLIRLLANQAIIDQAIPSQLAYIEIALRLLTQVERHKMQLEKEQLNAIFSGIEAKIKAELAGKASAFTAPVRTFVEKEKDPIIITTDEAHNLHEVLLLLAVSPSMDIKDEAKKAILELEKVKAKS